MAEALARDLKFFGASIGGIPDIATGVDGAELFPPADEPAMCAAIASWLRAGCPQPTKAAEDMRLRYHPDVIAQRHLEIYHEVLSASAKAAHTVS